MGGEGALAVFERLCGSCEAVSGASVETYQGVGEFIYI